MRYLSGISILFFGLLCIIASAEEQKNVYKAAVDKDGIQRVDVTAGEYFFNPSYIIVKMNVPVELKVKKEPTIVPHDFVLKDTEAGVDVLESLSSKPKSIKFTPTKTGKYVFYCDKKNHRKKGMEGVLEVVK